MVLIYERQMEKLMNTFTKNSKVLKATSYGSSANGNSTSSSDIDTTIVAPEKTCLNYSLSLTKAGEIDINQKVDLTIMSFWTRT